MIPVTVIGGFLGSGKTTLVNHLLRTAEKRWGVLVNDFGAIAIDAALVAARSANTIALTNGCVCCAMGDDLGAGLVQVAARAEHVIIEASGVGDPRRIAQLALVEPGFSLEPVVVLVDAGALAGQLADRWVADTVRGQIAGAELLVLNKIDRGDAGAAGRLAAEINPVARRLAVRDAAVPAEALQFPARPHGRFAADVPAEHAFRSWAWSPPNALDRVRLRALLGRLPGSVLRIKGFCVLEGRTHLLQFAAGQWTVTPSDPRETGLVVIGTAAMPDDETLGGWFDTTVMA